MLYCAVVFLQYATNPTIRYASVKLCYAVLSISVEHICALCSLCNVTTMHHFVNCHALQLCLTILYYTALWYIFVLDRSTMTILLILCTLATKMFIYHFHREICREGLHVYKKQHNLHCVLPCYWLDQLEKSQ